MDQEKVWHETPPLIRLFDESPLEAFLTHVECALAEIYPTPEMEELGLKEQLACASGVVQFVLDLVPDLQASGDRLTRFDVLAAVLTEANATLSDRLCTLVRGGGGEGGRSPQVENARLGDLHSIIDWLAKYQITLRGIKCPVAVAGAVTATSRLSEVCRTPHKCKAFELLPEICTLYVHGGSEGSKGGAAAHLYDHCIKVWESVVNNPEEMLQKHQNGTFYTHAPIDMWEAINQHMSLATATTSPVLHVMIAEKVVLSLQQVFQQIITYVLTMDTSGNPELREIELEYVSALANDTALHIEEVIELIDTFTIAEIRDRIDDIFDPLTTQVRTVHSTYCTGMHLIPFFFAVTLYLTLTLTYIHLPSPSIQLIKSYYHHTYLYNPLPTTY
ncbi:hypothetical protein B484DRAFT_55078 [Ochromonadaceae sp. CCMP2298]|nr:hypothetical protein B484DRAFT_55078 [Ochromonadaceae sp. CCMP2298]